MDFLMGTWSFFATNILTQPACFVGLMIPVGYLLSKKPLYGAFVGFIKATVGYMILAIGSGGLINSLRSILVGLKDRLNLDAMVTNPYLGQDAITVGPGGCFGRTFSQVILLLLIAFTMNPLFVCLKKWMKMRTVFTTGRVQVQQASTAFWLILSRFPTLGDTPILIFMGLIPGLYWAVGPNLIIEITQELTGDGGSAIIHQQMFGVVVFAKLVDRLKRKPTKRLDDLKLLGFLSVSNENVVATSIPIFPFFGAILLVLGKDYLVSMGFMKTVDNFFLYIITITLNFVVYPAILQLDVCTFATELTSSFQGVPNTLLSGVVPGIDHATIFGFGSTNAVTVGPLMEALGQFLAIMVLLLAKSPTLVIAGSVPVFSDNAAIAVYADSRGGVGTAMLFPLIPGLTQAFGSALVTDDVGFTVYDGYLGMFDQATAWPLSAIIMKFLGYFGVAIVVLILLAIPQL